MMMMIKYAGRFYSFRSFWTVSLLLHAMRSLSSEKVSHVDITQSVCRRVLWKWAGFVFVCLFFYSLMYITVESFNLLSLRPHSW